jgi:drug/metabolite transporter (DMT)-like permease
MSLTAVFLLTLSAILHATWNFLTKRSLASAAFFVVALLPVSLFTSPALFLYSSILPTLPITFWLLIIATGFFEATYMIGLGRAYRLGDMSLAYPLVRALPILLVVLISIILGRGEALSILGVSGMVLVTVGCLMLPLQTFKGWSVKSYFTKVMFWIVITAFAVAGYTAVDDVAIRFLRQPLAVTPSTILYTFFQASSTVLFLLLYLLFNKTERVVQLKDIPVACTVGLLSALTYALVLAALAFVKDVSYANAFRQLSIPIGALLGMWLAKEPHYFPKLIGIAIMFVGLILVMLG